MSQRKQLLEITYHNDDDTGMYEVGEVDFGICDEFDEYCKNYGRKGVKDILSTLNHLIWYVTQYGYPLAKQSEKETASSEIAKQFKNSVENKI